MDRFCFCPQNTPNRTCKINVQMTTNEKRGILLMLVRDSRSTIVKQVNKQDDSHVLGIHGTIPLGVRDF